MRYDWGDQALIDELGCEANGVVRVLDWIGPRVRAGDIDERTVFVGHGERAQ
jgi:hypothetical protein